MNNQLSIIDLLSILSFILGLENLDLNIKQSDNLEKHLQEQDNNMLKTIIKQNEEIIRLLKEGKNE